MKWKPDTLSYTAVAETRHDGLLEFEGKVLDCLTMAVQLFEQLEEQHPNDTHEFYSAIHVAQDLLAVRIARRLYPEGWPTHKPEKYVDLSEHVDAVTQLDDDGLEPIETEDVR